MATTPSTVPDPEPVDIASLMIQVPLTFGNPFGNPFRIERYGARGAGKPICGVCLFRLVPEAKASNVDADKDLSMIQNTWARSTRKEFQASAARGCSSCGAILEFALQYGAVELSLKQQSRWRGLTITREDKSVENFVFVAQLNENYKDLDIQAHNSICRGFGAASIKGTAEDEVLDKAKRWWERCTQEHDCRSESCPYIPRRLLHLDHHPDEMTTEVRLVEDLMEPVEYVALSHRWSEDTKAISLLNSNRCERMEKGLVSSGLPRLMQDTIHVLRRFGIQYLWVDCMCIIQDGIADWKREAGSMASIYKNATFTISAMHSRGSNETLFGGPRRTLADGLVGELPGGVPVHLEHHITHPFSHWTGSVEFGRLEDFDGTLDFKDLYLLSRGWVYQEILLSPRTLYFLANEVMWRCREYTVCQCARYDFDEHCKLYSGLEVTADIAGPLFYAARGSEKVGSRHWSSIVGQYSSKDLTYPQDRLPALAGIAEAYGKATGMTYICGLWGEDLQKTFGWSRYSHAHPAKRPECNIPTWSWASIGTQVSVGRHFAQQVEFESYHVIYNDERNHYIGDVKEAVLNIRGDVFPAKLVPLGHSNQLDDIVFAAFSGDWIVSILSRFNARLFEDCLLSETPDLVDTDILCLILDIPGQGYVAPGLCDCLVLRRVNDNFERYERLGHVWFEADGIPSDWRMQWNVSRKKLALV